MHDPMLELLFSEYRRKVLSLLFIEPGRAFHVRKLRGVPQLRPVLYIKS